MLHTPDPTASLPDVIATQTRSKHPHINASGSETHSQLPMSVPAGNRYILGEEIARGGMGEVYRATDTVMNREVAVKVLQSKYGPESGTVRRFFDEAQIIAYAHDVLHRDLKPHNVMVGSFGEVQVMDWGLAKVLTPTSMALEWIALAKHRLAPEPEDRFADAGAVAVANLRLAAEERARQAERDRVKTTEQRKRRRVQLALAGAMLMLLIAGGFGIMAASLWQTAEAERDVATSQKQIADMAKHEAIIAKEDALKAKSFADAAKNLAERAQAAEAEARKQVEQEREKLAIVEHGRTIQVAHLKWRDNNISSMRALLDSNDPKLRGNWEWRYLNRLAESLLLTLKRHSSNVTAANFSTNGTRIVTGSSDKTAKVADSRPIHENQPPTPAPPFHAQVKLGVLLQVKGDLDGAIAAYREAIRLDPKNVNAHFILGIALKDKGDLDSAIAAWRDTIRLDPKNALAHIYLGVALNQKGDLEGAIAAYREAIRLDPKNALAHYNLGIALGANGDLDGAIAANREAIRLHPTYAAAHYNLGIALNAKGDLDKGVAAYREAIRLDPKNANAHIYLGIALNAKGDLDKGIAAYREAIRLNPTYAGAHYNLGLALDQKGDLDGAIAAYREAIRLDPKLAIGQRNLSQVERMRKLMVRLEAVLTGTDHPSPSELCELAERCAQPFQKRYRDATRLYEQAFAKDPSLTDDLTAAHRYNAAFSAVLAAGGVGVTAPTDPAERATLRGKALAWLRADLAVLQKLTRSSKPDDRQHAALMLSHWLRDPDLMNVRPGIARIGLPADERAQWDALWADVRTALATAQKPQLPTSTKP